MFCEMYKSKEFKEEFKKKNKHINFNNEISNLNKLKSTSDLVDCELIHLSFFCFSDENCQCYTSDKKDLIRWRLNLYCASILYLEHFFYDHLPKKEPNSRYFKNIYQSIPRPPWKFCKVSVLDENTGKKIDEISTKEIYKKQYGEVTGLA